MRRARDDGVLASIELLEHLRDHLQREIVVPLQRENQAQALNVVLCEFPIPGLRALRRDKALLLKEPQLRGGQITEVALQAFENLSDAKERRLASRGDRLRPHLGLPRQIEAGSEEGELELPDLHLGAVVQQLFSFNANAVAVGAIQRAQVPHRE